jgi:hypothetical protein
MNPDREKQADEATHVGDCLLIALDEHGTDPNIGQSALGSAWYRLCQALEIKPDTFNIMCIGMSQMYARDWDKKKDAKQG